MHYTICVNFEAKIEAGAGPKSRLRLQPNTPAPGDSGRGSLRKRIFDPLCWKVNPYEFSTRSCHGKAKTITFIHTA